jgi:hypothetical protein
VLNVDYLSEDTLSSFGLGVADEFSVNELIDGVFGEDKLRWRKRAFSAKGKDLGSGLLDIVQFHGI